MSGKTRNSSGHAPGFVATLQPVQPEQERETREFAQNWGMHFRDKRSRHDFPLAIWSGPQEVTSMRRRELQLPQRVSRKLR
jgi:hypothetical protein